jgi:uncharacterized protein
MEIATRVLAIVAVVMLLTTGLSTTKALIEYSVVKSITVYAPAVSSTGEGVLSRIELAIAKPGSGRVFFSAIPYTEVETQGAARTAAYIASLIAGVEYSEYDYYVLLESTTPLVGGPSAGALFAIGFTALFLNTTLSSNVTMTGMINPDGTIGPVGGLKEKLEASSKAGFKTFLIPAGQRYYNYPVYEEIRVGPFLLRRVRYERVDLVEYGRALGVRVVEVSNVIEAFYYFTGFNLSSTPEWVVKPFTGSVKIQTYTLSLLDEARSLLNSAYTIASQLGYYGRGIRAAVSSINKSIDYYEGLVESYPTYTSYKSISVYVESMRYYWLARYLVSRDLSFIPAYINETLSGYVAILSDTSRCTLSTSLKQTLVYTAWLSYVKARELQDYNEVIGYALISIRNLKLIDLLERAVVRDVELETSASKISELYSHALALSAYVERLLELMGRGSTLSSELSMRLEALNHAYTSNACMVVGATILVIESVTSSLHSALGDTSTLPSRLLPIVYRLGTIEISDIVSLYHQAYIESSEVRDLETSSSALISLVAILQVSRASAIASTSLQTPEFITTPTPSRTTSTPSSSESSVKSPETTTSSTTQTGYPASWIVLLTLLTILILISLITVLILWKKL